MTCRVPTSCAFVVCIAALAACGDGTTEPAGAPATLTVVAGAGQKATVATAVAIPPSVRVTDADGRPVRGVPITFAVTAGGGTVVGSPATTNANGVATITSWTLGTGAWTLGQVAGAHTLTVTGAGLPAVTIGATANPGAPARAEKASTDGNSALPNRPVAPPAVKVEDAYGNPVPDVTVTFRVTAGGGHLGGGGGALTDQSGVARVSWTLGGVGVNTVTATVNDLPPLTFTATALDPCVDLTTALTIGSVVSANISPNDCLEIEYNRRSDRYTLTLAQQQEFVLGINSTEALVGFRLDGAGRPLLDTWMAELDAPRVGRFSLPAGTYLLRAVQSPWHPSPGPVTVAYTLTTTPGLPNDCGTTHTVRGITVTGSLVQDDCVSESNGQHYFDRYAVYLHPGDRLSVSAQAEGSWITEIRTTELIATSGEPRTNPGITITATEVGYHYVVLINATNDLATGDYTLTIAQ